MAIDRNGYQGPSARTESLEDIYRDFDSSGVAGRDDFRSEFHVRLLMAGSADSSNGRDHSATRHDGVYTGRPATLRLLADLLRTRRRSAVTDNIFTVSTKSGNPDPQKATRRIIDAMN
jgi:hypothetical protein